MDENNIARKILGFDDVSFICVSSVSSWDYDLALFWQESVIITVRGTNWLLFLMLWCVYCPVRTRFLIVFSKYLMLY
jgi:hypothetical protein